MSLSGSATARSAARAFRDLAVDRLAGDPVLTSIRPERMRILEPDEAANSFIEGKVVSCAFLGRHARYVVHADDQIGRRQHGRLVGAIGSSLRARRSGSAG